MTDARELLEIIADYIDKRNAVGLGLVDEVELDEIAERFADHVAHTMARLRPQSR